MSQNLGIRPQTLNTLNDQRTGEMVINEVLDIAIMDFKITHDEYKLIRNIAANYGMDQERLNDIIVTKLKEAGVSSAWELHLLKLDGRCMVSITSPEGPVGTVDIPIALSTFTALGLFMREGFVMDPAVPVGPVPLETVTASGLTALVHCGKGIVAVIFAKSFIPPGLADNLNAIVADIEARFPFITDWNGEFDAKVEELTAALCQAVSEHGGQVNPRQP